MSADTYKPNTKMTPAKIAIPAAPALMPNHPKPMPSVERQPVGAVNSPNEAGGYVGPAAFKHSQPKG